MYSSLNQLTHLCHSQACINKITIMVLVHLAVVKFIYIYTYILSCGCLRNVGVDCWCKCIIIILRNGVRSCHFSCFKEKRPCYYIRKISSSPLLAYCLLKWLKLRIQNSKQTSLHVFPFTFKMLSFCLLYTSSTHVKVLY